MEFYVIKDSCPPGCKGIQITPRKFSGCSCSYAGCDCPNHETLHAIKWCANCGKWEARCVCKLPVISVDPAPLDVRVVSLRMPPPTLAFAYGSGVRG